MSHARRLREAKVEQLAETQNATVAKPATKPARLAPLTPAMMRMSPAKRHVAMVAAGLAIAATASAGKAAARPETGPAATAYDLLRNQLSQHMAELRDIKSTEGKVDAKRKMLADYEDHIDTVLATTKETGAAVQDEVFIRLMMWHFDCGLYDRAIEMAEHVLKYKLALPEQFKRSPAELIEELVAEGAQKAIDLRQDFDITVLQMTELLVADFDIVDIVRAKFHKAFGLLLARAADSMTEASDGPAGGQRAARTEALKHLMRAVELNKNVGVKRDIENLERALKNSAST